MANCLQLVRYASTSSIYSTELVGGLQFWSNVSLRLASLVLTYSICYKFLFVVDYLCFFPCLRPVLKYRHPSPVSLPSRLSLLDVSLLLIILILSWYPTTSSLKNSVFKRNYAFVFGSGIYPCFDLLKDHYIILLHQIITSYYEESSDLNWGKPYSQNNSAYHKLIVNILRLSNSIWNEDFDSWGLLLLSGLVCFCTHFHIVCVFALLLYFILLFVWSGLLFHKNFKSHFIGLPLDHPIRRW